MKLLRWVVINTAFAACVYYALVKNVGWCDNIMVFVTWLHAIITFLGACTGIKHDRNIPDWMEVGYDVCLILSLAAFGRFGLATLWVIEAISVYVMHEAAKKQCKP